MKKWLLLLLSLCLAIGLVACGGNENIVDDIEGPEGIEDFAGIWYCENQNLWVEIYYDGSWCSFEDGGMIRSYGPMTIQEKVGTLTPTEGTDTFVLTASEGSLTDDRGNAMFKVTEVGIRKPLMVNTSGAPDTLETDAKVEGTADLSFAKKYEGFYISEDRIYALEIFTDGTYEFQEYGLMVESGTVLRLTAPEAGQLYLVDTDMLKYRLVLPEEERLYIGDCGAFAPGEKSTGGEE